MLESLGTVSSVTLWPTLHPVCELEVLLGEPRDHGVTRDGHRKFTPVLGGWLRGLPGTEFESLHAEVLPGGGDRQLWREDNGVTIVEIDASYDVKTETCELISVRVEGIRNVSGEGTYFMVQLRFETSSLAHAGLQRALFVADGVRQADRVQHTVFLVSAPI
jgi:hypothetical protein